MSNQYASYNKIMYKRTHLPGQRKQTKPVKTTCIKGERNGGIWTPKTLYPAPYAGGEGCPPDSAVDSTLAVFSSAIFKTYEQLLLFYTEELRTTLQNLIVENSSRKFEILGRPRLHKVDGYQHGIEVNPE